MEDERRRECLWVLRAQTGDREALERVFEVLGGAVRGYLRGLAPTHADDLLQDVLVIVYRKLGYLRAPEQLRPWAYRIASRVAFRSLRKEKARGLPADPAILETMPPIPAFDEARATVLDREARELLGAVPPARRVALDAHVNRCTQRVLKALELVVPNP